VLRLIRWTATGLVVVLALMWGVVWMARDAPAGHAAMLVSAVAAWTRPSPPSLETGLGGPFSLVDSNDRPVTDQSFPGKWMLIYFGYTYCPDVCPTTLQTISNVLDQLGDKAAQIVPLFITVDPERDTPAAVGQYVTLFDPRLIGLTGTTLQVDAAKSAYRVFSRRVNAPTGDGYTVDHSSYIYLEGPDGKVKALFKDGMTEADMVVAITAAMSQRGK
jgi:cytochrome oxidase Cu insertion factor (SCO1/SenC/PrrC family)